MIKREEFKNLIFDNDWSNYKETLLRLQKGKEKAKLVRVKKPFMGHFPVSGIPHFLVAMKEKKEVGVMGIQLLSSGHGYYTSPSLSRKEAEELYHKLSDNIITISLLEDLGWTSHKIGAELND